MKKSVSVMAGLLIMWGLVMVVVPEGRSPSSSKPAAVNAVL
ncbi:MULTISPECIES: hypothetical protein [Cellvibrio]|nr:MULTISPECIES: hypothetical protein [Cellvibrio]